MSNRIVLFSDEDMKLSYEVIQENLFIHVEYDNFSKSILNKTRKLWKEFLLRAFFDGWEEIFTYTKDPRIVKMIGGAEELYDSKLQRLGLRMFKWDLR